LIHTGAVPSSNDEVVRGSLEAFREGDYEAAMRALDPDVEYDLTHFPEGNIYHGHSGVREAFRLWLGAWDDYRQEISEVTSSGEKVVVVGREIGRGKGSGVEVDRAIFAVWTMHRGKAIRIRFFGSRNEARRDAGLAPG
jgi:ketosteroid isomerase-like protein